MYHIHIISESFDSLSCSNLTHPKLRGLPPGAVPHRGKGGRLRGRTTLSSAVSGPPSLCPQLCRSTGRPDFLRSEVWGDPLQRSPHLPDSPFEK